MIKNNVLTLALIICSNFLFAQQPGVGEIKMFAGNFSPEGWASSDEFSMLNYHNFTVPFFFVNILCILLMIF